MLELFAFGRRRFRGISCIAEVQIEVYSAWYGEIFEVHQGFVIVSVLIQAEISFDLKGETRKFVKILLGFMF